MDNYIGKVGARFSMDTDAALVKKACEQMLKKGLRQQRHRLKKKYFDPYPLHLVRKTSPVQSMTDEQWNNLVESWKDHKKMETCEKNKVNRSKVKFHQTTGSRSYDVHCENLGDKYKDQPPNALDLFKECHYSKKKKGYTSTVEVAIGQMETRLTEPIADGQQPKSVTEVVSEVLTENTQKNQFLQNVGLQSVPTRSRAVSGHNLEAGLATERRGTAELREVVNTQREQMDALSKKLQEAEEARLRQEEEMKKKQAETDAILQRLLRAIPPSQATR